MGTPRLRERRRVLRFECLEDRRLLSVATPAMLPAQDQVPWADEPLPPGPQSAFVERWIPYTPTPAQTSITVIHAAGQWNAAVEIEFSHSGHRVPAWGIVQRIGSTFSVDATVEQWTGMAAQVITTVSHAYPLGSLDQGEYAFQFFANGSFVESQPFTVPNQPPRLEGLTADRDPVTRGAPLTVSASGISDPDGTVLRVAFYRGDDLLGTDESGSDGWSWSGSTAGWPVGEVTVSARAQDESGAWSEPVTTAVTVTSWQNPRLRFDVNDDGFASALDVLLVINHIHRSTGPELPPRLGDEPYYDVNGDGQLTAADVLDVINRINFGSETGEAAGRVGGGETTRAASVADVASWPAPASRDVASVAGQVAAPVSPLGSGEAGAGILPLPAPRTSSDPWLPESSNRRRSLSREAVPEELGVFVGGQADSSRSAAPLSAGILP